MKIVVRINFEFVSYDVFAHCKALAWVFILARAGFIRCNFPRKIIRWVVCYHPLTK